MFTENTALKKRLCDLALWDSMKSSCTSIEKLCFNLAIILSYVVMLQLCLHVPSFTFFPPPHLPRCLTAFITLRVLLRWLRIHQQQLVCLTLRRTRQVVQPVPEQQLQLVLTFELLHQLLSGD